jgi:IS30 family transposase
MKVAMNSFLTRFVREKIVLKWSPEQMSQYLSIRMNIHVSTKAIYKFFRTRGLEHYLFWSWNKRKTGRKRYTYNTPQDQRKYIDERPCVEGYGHYEMDFIVSKHTSTVLLVVVEM